MKVSIGFLTILLTTTLTACSTIPKPIDKNVVFPHTFAKVGYLEKYGWQIGFDHIANLTVETNKIVFADEDINLVIMFESIEAITYKKPFFTDPNNYVIITYRDTETNKQAFFTAFRYSGWVGGSSEIYNVIQLAYKRYKAMNMHSN
jgi:hypothetical protein